MPIPILVVDDEPNFLMLMRKALGRRGFEVSIAATASAALDLLDHEFFNFALVDLRLGGGSGMELLADLKQRKPNVHAIVVTGYPSDETRAAARDNGASAYLIKPVTINNLFDAMTKILTN
ncbi:MAG TPA: response regulator [Candidatus Binatia bacterium]|jgi:two-component system response regulator RegA